MPNIWAEDDIYKKGNEPSTSFSGCRVRNLLPFCWAAGKADTLQQRAAVGAQLPFNMKNIDLKATGERMLDFKNLICILWLLFFPREATL